MKILMVDVDGVLVRSHPVGWARDLEADLGLSPAFLHAEFFDIHWAEIAVGRATLPALTRWLFLGWNLVGLVVSLLWSRRHSVLAEN
ncbi:MAG: hypothetical protein IM664_12340 [Phenylobacterium sp.]|uniref:hypothetical protein n=1 Tax=Phenylobacterium sp. TaxID=1871053 RepID=UPI0025E54465|nr:hypothetical protein [Phenylobacterium sp.]MCA6335381.1 hypothetical protein [Phenylobacterium sp.]